MIGRCQRSLGRLTVLRTPAWRALLQKQTAFMDGVPGMTQCPIATAPLSRTASKQICMARPGGTPTSRRNTEAACSALW